VNNSAHIKLIRDYADSNVLQLALMCRWYSHTYRAPITQQVVNDCCQKIDAELDRVRAIITAPRKKKTTKRNEPTKKFMTALLHQKHSILGCDRMSAAEENMDHIRDEDQSGEDSE
jgi:hypothetical protein